MRRYSGHRGKEVAVPSFLAFLAISLGCYAWHRDIVH
jgi:hypothetical protein